MIMANWEKLNNEFDKVINNLTDSDWDNWMKNRQQNKLMRRSEMILKAQIQAKKIFFDSQQGNKIVEDLLKQSSTNLLSADDFVISGLDCLGEENSYAMAA
jgi:hypothetical protein